jgi:glycosyltransferase involved in cell wall biosynthesis
MTPTVSIIMPTYNRENIVGRAMRSVVGQTFDKWEFIVVDDCSTDGTPRIIKEFSESRIRYIRHTENLGVSHARNTGIRSADDSRYLAYIDDDDEWMPKKLELQIALFERSHDELAAVGCGRIDCERGVSEVLLPAHRGWIFEHILARRGRGYGAPLILVRRYPGEPDTLFDVSFPCLEDMDYALQLAKNRPMDYVPEPLVKVHRESDRQHLWNPENTFFGYRRILEKYSEEITSRPEILSHYLFCMAKELASVGRMGEARRMLMRSRHGAVGRGKLYLWYASTFFGSLGMRACARYFTVSPPEVPVKEGY